MRLLNHRHLSILASLLMLSLADAATVTSFWNVAWGDWSVPANWIHVPADASADFPDNDALTYNVSLTNGTVVLGQPTTIDSLIFTGGLLSNNSTLTLAKWGNWSGGTLSGTGKVVSVGMEVTGGTNESTLQLIAFGSEFSSMHQSGAVLLETSYAKFDSCLVSGSFAVATNAHLFFGSNYFAAGSSHVSAWLLRPGYDEPDTEELADDWLPRGGDEHSDRH